MTVNVTIISANFPYKGFKTLSCGRFEERFLNLEHLFLHIFWSLNVKLALNGRKQELLVECLLCGQTDSCENSVNTPLNFAGKTLAIFVVDD